MERLTDVAELLDGPLDDPAALAGNLRDLRRINRRLGGVRLTAAAIEALAAHRDELTMLDVGTGGADIPSALIERARARGRRVRVVGIDPKVKVLAAAVRANPALATTDDLELQIGDGRWLRFSNRSFDIAHVSLVLHHLEPATVVTVLREMGRVSRLGVVVNDLERSRLGWIGAWLIGHLLTRNRLTRHDAPMSVRRAYSSNEMGQMLEAAGLLPVTRVHGAFGHRYAIAAVIKPKPGEDAPARPPDPQGAGNL